MVFQKLLTTCSILQLLTLLLDQTKAFGHIDVSAHRTLRPGPVRPRTSHRSSGSRVPSRLPVSGAHTQFPLSRVAEECSSSPISSSSARITGDAMLRALHYSDTEYADDRHYEYLDGVKNNQW